MRKILALLSAAFLLLFMFVAPASAQEYTGDSNALAPVGAFELDAFTVVLITSALIPFVVGLVTKANASATVKQLVLLVVSAVSGVIQTSTQADGTAWISFTTLQYTALSLFIAIVSYLGLYKPHDANARLLPNVGIAKLWPGGS